MDSTRQTQPTPDDYYGTVYKGGLIVPILGILIFALVLWWLLRKRKL